MKVWTRTALANLDAEATYIARENPSAAQRLVERIQNAVHQLTDYPSLGRPGRVPGTRELVVPGTPHILPYRVCHGAVEILRLFRAARQWPGRL